MTQQLTDWFGQPIATPTQPKKGENPCVALYGKGLEGQTCQNCAQLAGICKAKTYYKCRLRDNTHGAKTDHKLKWPACAKFEQREKSIPLYDGR